MAVHNVASHVPSIPRYNLRRYPQQNWRELGRTIGVRNRQLVFAEVNEAAFRFAEAGLMPGAFGRPGNEFRRPASLWLYEHTIGEHIQGTGPNKVEAIGGIPLVTMIGVETVHGSSYGIGFIGSEQEGEGQRYFFQFYADIAKSTGKPPRIELNP